MLDDKDIEKLKKLFGVQFDGLSNTFDKKLDTMSNTFDKKLDTMSNTFDNKLDTISKTFDEKLDVIVRDISVIKNDVKDLKEDVVAVKEIAQGHSVGLDGIAKSYDKLDTEYVSIKNQVNRHEKWHNQIADKIGVTLEK